jgi:hypothetical protein
MLNVFHSYIPKEINHPSLKGIIWKEQLYPQLLSVLLSKKYYGNISLFTNQHTKKQMIDIGVPYDNFDTILLEKERSDTFSYYKLKVFENLKEEFLHIDTDTILYKNFNFNEISKDFLFSHPDQPNLNDINEKHLEIISKTYTSLFYILENQHSDFFKRNFKISKIPNMSLVYVKDYESFNRASNKSINHYLKNKKLIDNTEYGACYIEQLHVHLNLMEISETYRKQTENNSNFLSNNEFLIVLQEKGQENFDKNDYHYPVRWKFSIPKSSPINEHLFDNLFLNDRHYYENKEIKIKDEKDLIKMFDFDFFGIQHLTYNKWSKLFQCICIGYIHKHFGEKWLYGVYNYYKKIYPTYNLKILSDGEKLYEEITGFKFE